MPSQDSMLQMICQKTLNLCSPPVWLSVCHSGPWMRTLRFPVSLILLPRGVPQQTPMSLAAKVPLLIHTAHTSLGTGHPGTNKTLSLLQDSFWWPGMANDIRRYVRRCQECTMAKIPRHLPSGKILPLPIPWRRCRNRFSHGLTSIQW